MPILLATATIALLAVAVRAQTPCAGEYSVCANGACALVPEACAQCGAGQYACPLSSSCAASADAVAACPGLAGTHFDSSLPVEARLDYIFSQALTVDELTSQMTDNASSIPRLSVPAYVWLNDDQHGVKQPDATAFPNGNAMGASWDTDLIHAIGLALGTEARGVHNSLLDKSAQTGGEGWPGTLRNGAGLTAYAPNVNLVHDPRWGRAQEVMSECPHLTGQLVAAYVTGMQNATTAAAASTGPLLMAACCKHYAIYNVENIPADRTVFNAVVGARDLWETYLPVFESCIVAGQSQSVMCSYNAVNGVPTCASAGLLTEVLRATWNFSGFVVSDYDAWANIVSTHHYAADWTQAAVDGLTAGMDQEGGGGPSYPPVQTGIPAALAAGRLTTAQVQAAVRRLLRVRIRLGMFDAPTAVPYNAITHADVASPAHLALAEAGARAGLTLLRNGAPAGGAGGAPALPLSLPALAGKRLAVLGPNANASYILLGSYSDPSCCKTGGIPSVLAELGARAAAAGVAVDYAPGCVNSSCLATDGFAAAAAAASTADAVVLVLGMGQAAYDCGGDRDRTACESEAHDRETCALPGGQPALVAAVRAALRPGVPLAAVLVHGGALCLLPETLGALDALLDAWYPGMRGGAAIADVLTGAFSPAGRSPVTWYASDAALPADRGQMSPYPNASAGSPGITYRFYDEAAAGGAPVVFSFGEGLSYTTFDVSAPQAPAAVGPCDPLPLSVTVANTGAAPSDVVLQVFLAQPGASAVGPATRLVAFTRVAGLAPGERRAVTLPAIAPTARALIHEAGGDGGDIFAVAGKRWNEAGSLQLRVVTGQHGGDRAGGLAVTVVQTGSQDLATC